MIANRLAAVVATWVFAVVCDRPLYSCVRSRCDSWTWIACGLKGLIVGIANERSIAWGCAKAFRALGAEVAITYVNDKTRSYVEPLVRAFLEIGLGLQLARASSSIGAARSTASRVLFVLLAQML